MGKVRVGISFDHEVVELLDEQVRGSPDLSADRSEVVNAVVRSFFDDDERRAEGDPRLGMRELLVRERMRSCKQRRAVRS